MASRGSLPMKAIQLHQAGSLDQLKYEAVETPSASEWPVLIKVVSASVNFADVMILRSNYPIMPPLPIIPSIDCSGIIESVGQSVSQFRIKKRKTTLGIVVGNSMQKADVGAEYASFKHALHRRYA